MVDGYVIRRLVRSFPGSFINHLLEFIAHGEANESFLLENCMNELDVKCKVLEWLSRGAYKTCPYRSRTKNEKFNSFMLNGINEFLETDFTEEDMAIIYQKLGNRVNHSLTVRFIESGYDMALLNKEYISKDIKTEKYISEDIGTEG